MSNPERLIRSIIGDTGSSIYPLACAAEIVGREFFDSHTPLEDVKPGQVYTQVSKEMGISFDAASKRILLGVYAETRAGGAVHWPDAGRQSQRLPSRGISGLLRLL